MNKGQVSPILLWAIGLMASAGMGLNLFGMSSDTRQDQAISVINREVGVMSADVRYIKEAVDELREARGLIRASSTNQTRLP